MLSRSILMDIFNKLLPGHFEKSIPLFGAGHLTLERKIVKYSTLGSLCTPRLKKRNAEENTKQNGLREGRGWIKIRPCRKLGSFAKDLIMVLLTEPVHTFLYRGHQGIPYL